jgi:hypothetical protein
MTAAAMRLWNLLRAEGYPITIRNSGAPEQLQRMQATAAIRQAIKTEYYDWWLTLDADEFLQGDREQLEEELSKVSPGHCASVRWLTYVPFHSGADWNLHRDFKAMTDDPNAYVKVSPKT